MYSLLEIAMNIVLDVTFSLSEVCVIHMTFGRCVSRVVGFH